MHLSCRSLAHTHTTTQVFATDMVDTCDGCRGLYGGKVGCDSVDWRTYYSTGIRQKGVHLKTNLRLPLTRRFTPPERFGHNEHEIRRFTFRSANTFCICYGCTLADDALLTTAVVAGKILQLLIVRGGTLRSSALLCLTDAFVARNVFCTGKYLFQLIGFTSSAN